MKIYGSRHLILNQAREALLSETDCRMLIFSVGGEFIAEKENLHQLKVLRTLAPTVPLVVISDRKDGNDIVAAFSVEVQGYLIAGSPQRSHATHCPSSELQVPSPAFSREEEVGGSHNISLLQVSNDFESHSNTTA